MKTISRAETKTPLKTRKPRTPTGRWAPYIKQLRERIEGVGSDGKPRLKQQEFGAFFQTAAITVSRWEGSGRPQDPPRPMLRKLALLAGLYGYRDLELVFNADEPNASAIQKKDQNIVLLLGCLMRWKDVDATSSDNRSAEIHRAGQAVFELARNIVAASSSSKTVDLARQRLLSEMTRLLEAIYADEHQFMSGTLRAMGVLMYSEGEPDFRMINYAKSNAEALRKKQAERHAAEDQEGTEK